MLLYQMNMSVLLLKQFLRVPDLSRAMIKQVVMLPIYMPMVLNPISLVQSIAISILNRKVLLQISILRFSSYFSGLFAGKIFSEGDIVLNYRSDKKNIVLKRHIGEFEKNKTTLFTNYDKAGNFTEMGLLTRESISMELYKSRNNLVYLKKFSEYRPYESIFDIDPVRIVSSITIKKKAEYSGGEVQIEIPEEGPYARYRCLDYDKWLSELSNESERNKNKNIQKLFKDMNLFYLRLASEGLKGSHISSIHNYEEIRFVTAQWMKKKKKKIKLNLAAFFEWYRGKYKMRIPVIDRGVHTNRALMLYFDAGDKDVDLELTSTEEIPFRCFFIFSSPVTFTSDVNVNNGPFYILADDFTVKPAIKIDQIKINAVLMSNNLPDAIQNFPATEWDLSDTKVSLNGAFSFLRHPFSGGNSRRLNPEYKPEINFKWNVDLLSRKNWINFVPSKYYLSE